MVRFQRAPACAGGCNGSNEQTLCSACVRESEVRELLATRMGEFSDAELELLLRGYARRRTMTGAR